MDREKIKHTILESFQADDGCGSDLETGDLEGEWLPVNGRLDIEHLVSEVEWLCQQAVRKASDG